MSASGPRLRFHGAATPELEYVLGDIAAERVRQDEQWGGPKHDDEHTPEDWSNWRGKQARRAEMAWLCNDNAGCRAALVKLAALAVAQIEQLDRFEARGDGGGDVVPVRLVGSALNALPEHEAVRCLRDGYTVRAVPASLMRAYRAAHDEATRLRQEIENAPEYELALRVRVPEPAEAPTYPPNAVDG